MTEFEKWFATTGYTDMDGPVPLKVAQQAWDAAIEWATDELMESQDHDCWIG